MDVGFFSFDNSNFPYFNFFLKLFNCLCVIDIICFDIFLNIVVDKLIDKSIIIIPNILAPRNKIKNK